MTDNNIDATGEYRRGRKEEENSSGVAAQEATVEIGDSSGRVRSAGALGPGQGL